MTAHDNTHERQLAKPSVPVMKMIDGKACWLKFGTNEYVHEPELEAIYMAAQPLKAPFPYFGGKSRIAAQVWQRFGKPQNFVEPFFGSGAVLLGCPHPGHTETVNDIDALLANFWRALASDPEAVAHYADWPVNEVDLHARHRYLRDARGRAEALMADPERYDAKLAGWWVWGISQWIGSGWCPPQGELSQKMPHLQNGDRTEGSRGVHRVSLHDHKQTTKDGEVWTKRPQLSDNRGVHRKRPAIGGRGHPSSVGGVHRESLSRKLPSIGAGDGTNGQRGVTSDTVATGGIYAYFDALSARLRRVRVCCGDWRRVTGPSVTYRHGLTAVFLDPPYVQDGRADVYGYEERIFEDVRDWAIENGPNPLMRIALCGYDFEMPDGWKGVRWKAPGGYGSQGDGQGRENAHREMIWFSPACLDPSELARDAMSRPIKVAESDYTGTLFAFESEAAA